MQVTLVSGEAAETESEEFFFQTRQELASVSVAGRAANCNGGEGRGCR